LIGTTFMAISAELVAVGTPLGMARIKA